MNECVDAGRCFFLAPTGRSMILFTDHFQYIDEQVDHVIVKSNSAKDVILFTHLIFGVFAAVCAQTRKIESNGEEITRLCERVQ